MPAGAKIGTSSLRRRAQILAIRPDREVVEYRGNVQTRLRKLEEGVAEAILAKHRNGPTGTITLGFNKQCTRFENYTPREPEGDVF